MCFVVVSSESDSISFCQAKEALFYSIVVTYHRHDCNLYEEDPCFQLLLFIPIRCWFIVWQSAHPSWHFPKAYAYLARSRSPTLSDRGGSFTDCADREQAEKHTWEERGKQCPSYIKRILDSPGMCLDLSAFES
jgi:hypothetical protein